MMQLLLKKVWSFHKKLKIPYSLVTPLLGIYAKKTKSVSWRDIYTMFTTALYIIARTWKWPKYPLMDQWIKKMWDRYISIYTHTQTYIYIYVCVYMYIYIYTHTERDIKIGSPSFAATYMDLEGIITLGNRLAKKFVQVFLYHLMEKPKWTFWPIQKNMSEKDKNLWSHLYVE